MVCRGSVCHGLREKRLIGAVLKGFCPMSYFSFPSAMEQGFLSRTHRIMCNLKKCLARGKALFINNYL